MPVQPQYSIGPLGQPAPPDASHIPSHDGHARYMRSTPPGMFAAEPSESCQRQSVDITILNTVLSPMQRTPANPPGLSAHPNRRTPDGFPCLDSANVPVGARQEHQHIPPCSDFDALRQTAMTSETPMSYSTLCAQNPVNMLNSQSRNGFNVVNEDFPALPCISEFPEDNIQDEESRRPSSSPQVEPEPRGGLPIRERYDLRSFIDQWSSAEFIAGFEVLNCNDLVRRTTKLHPLGKCLVESVTRPLPVMSLKIGVTLVNQCTQLHEPEDLRTEDAFSRIVNGHKVPVPENDKYYAMSDDLKDKLRNPQLQLMDDFTLFFQFYFFTRDAQQLVAADALFKRNWRWNKKISRWCQLEKAHTTGGVQAGVFNVYDPVSCRIQPTVLQYLSQDFELYPPVIPPPKTRAHNVNDEERL